ncbi:MAG: flagellar motor switch protein FliN [Gemmatimonadaceae bacterium]|nr:flagellar motor switch protein FliN [Gemmatimonadaceae bacterium]
MNNAEIDALFASAKQPKAAAPAASTAVLDAAPPAVESFTDLGQPSMGSGEVPMAMLLDLTLPVSIELGRTSMTVQEILRLGRGSVVQLEKLAGEPIDIYVGDRRFAEGEVVVLGEHFGVRITRILQTAQAAAAA